MNEERPKTNRLILIGNGFDKAHGLPTSYQDFMFSHLKVAFSHKPSELIEYKHHEHLHNFLKGIDNLASFQKKVTSDADIKIVKCIEFLNKLLKEMQKDRWVDIENLYFEELKRILNETFSNESKEDVKRHKQYEINKLNSDFDSIKKELISYLIEVCSNQSTMALDCFNKIFDEPLITDKPVILPTERPANTLFLNFNYTNTLKKYLSNRKNKYKIINIHGQLEDETNPIIFGFGDEKDRLYPEIEEFGDNSVLRFIKSFMYLKNNNYQNLIRYIESAPYEVFIIGHSCGLSDRVMLKTIFESDNCKKIKIYYYKDEANFTNTVMEISRHFDNKAAMRMKIVPFEESSECPQVQTSGKI
ncbi:MAG: hypothetical protein JXR58_10450 [Bacteroidales bacterium]|nr:hypothetical protein [Bacteroidales bacterium]